MLPLSSLTEPGLPPTMGMVAWEDLITALNLSRKKLSLITECVSSLHLGSLHSRVSLDILEQE